MRERFLESARNICDFCALYNESKIAFSAKDSPAKKLKENQINLAETLKLIISEKEYDDVYDVKISKGMPSVPRVPWISLIRKGTKIYNNLSITICFGRTGNGFVFGLMKPVEYNKKLSISTIIRKKCDDFIDIDSNRRSTSYNNMFIDSVDFNKKNFNFDLFLNTLIDSIVLEHKYYLMASELEYSNT